MKIGILGKGQLGRMLGEAFEDLGHRDYDLLDPLDPERWNEYERLTYESENIPAHLLAGIKDKLFPSLNILRICQNRIAEKDFLRSCDLPVAPYFVVRSTDDLNAALRLLGPDLILKSAMGGYDGKSQWTLNEKTRFSLKEKINGYDEFVAEKKLPLQSECSVSVVRNRNSEIFSFPVIDNVHVEGILSASTVPSTLSPELQKKALDMARAIAEQLSLIGLLCVEFFVCNEDIIVNELAPRPHNSAHITRCATRRSQFHALAHCLLDLALQTEDFELGTTLHHCLVNILGNQQGSLPSLQLTNSARELYYYDKLSKPKRKLGHAIFSFASARDAQRCARDWQIKTEREQQC